MLGRVEIVVKAGDGGDGAISFRREKFVPFGGPDGGDGGDGGDVIILADASVSSFRQFERGRFYRAGDGGAGKGKKKYGKKGEDKMIKVPVGAIVLVEGPSGSEELVADWERPGQPVVLARGGKGGWGNVHFVSSTNQAPRLAQKGEVGEEKALILELRLMVDVGIIGYPNVGKSTLLVAASAAKAKIASYPFTTLEPVLGVVTVGEQSFVLAEIPGLIEGAHTGRGLGHEFLRHALRTKILIHLLDGTSASPIEGMLRVNTELGLFDLALEQKPQLVVVNKIDLPEVQARLAEIRDAFQQVGLPVFFISAAKGEGVAELLAEVVKMLKQVPAEAMAGEKIREKVFHPQPRDSKSIVSREGDTFIVVAPELARLVARVDMTSSEIRGQLRKQMARLGISQALEKAGIKFGDKVRCGQFEWDW